MSHACHGASGSGFIGGVIQVGAYCTAVYSCYNEDMTKREIALSYLKTLQGLPYKWGGNDSIEGYDCSGLAVEMLKSVGIIENNADFTAQGLSLRFTETDYLFDGNLVFWDWDNDGVVDHVEIIAHTDEDGQVFTIGASGGGSATTSPQVASQHDAYVKLRPLRSGYKMVNDPFITPPK